MATPIRIPFNVPYLAGKEAAYIGEALASRRHCGNNDFCSRVQKWFQSAIGVSEVFLTPSCTAALEMGALLADLKPGDEVLMPSYTFSSTANAVVLTGARPVFCEVDPVTLNIDPKDVERRLTPRSRMILPIHYAGIPADMDAINKIAKKYSLIVMEDAAQAVGSTYKGKPAGLLCDLGAYSFHETKNISCGEGGALLVNRPEWTQRAHFLQEKGTDRSLVLRGVQSKYGWVDKGSSFLLSDILAAMLLAQLEEMNTIIERRRAVWEVYARLFEPFVGRGCVTVTVIPPDVKSNYHAFFTVFRNSTDSERFIALLKEQAIFAYIGYVPLHSSVFGRKQGWKPEDLPLTEDLGQRVVRLPLYAELSGAPLDYTIEAMSKVLRTIYR